MKRPRLDKQQKRELVERNVAEFEVEAAREMAAAYGKAVGKLADAAQAVRDRLASAEALVGAERRRALEEARVLRKTALRVQWELKVHRDALGLRGHQAVLEQFPIPKVPKG